MFSKDRLESLGDALKRLKELLERPDVDSIDYLRDAVIHRFEFTVELYWKVLKMILAYEKIESNTPRDVLSKAFQFRLIDNEKIWLAMLDDRNSTSHVYNEEDARKVFLRIKTYTPLLESTYVKLQDKYS